VAIVPVDRLIPAATGGYGHTSGSLTPRQPSTTGLGVVTLIFAVGSSLESRSSTRRPRNRSDFVVAALQYPRPLAAGGVTLPATTVCEDL